jgi:hypothetical protein
VDNQAAIRVFDSDLRRPRHHLAREFLKITNRIQKRKNRRGCRLTIRWTAGHSGIMGNERADSEAKKAASGKHSEIKHLPTYLRKPLLISPVALKRSHGDALKNRWKTEWTTSARGKKMLRIDSSTPSSKVLKTISNTNLSRMATRPRTCGAPYGQNTAPSLRAQATPRTRRSVPSSPPRSSLG